MALGTELFHIWGWFWTRSICYCCGDCKTNTCDNCYSQESETSNRRMPVRICLYLCQFIVLLSFLVSFITFYTNFGTGFATANFLCEINDIQIEWIDSSIMSTNMTNLEWEMGSVYVDPSPGHSRGICYNANGTVFDDVYANDDKEKLICIDFFKLGGTVDHIISIYDQSETQNSVREYNYYTKFSITYKSCETEWCVINGPSGYTLLKENNFIASVSWSINYLFANVTDCVA